MFMFEYANNISIQDFLKEENLQMESTEQETNLIKITAAGYFEADFQGFSNFAAQRDGDWVWKQCTWDLNSDVADGVEIPHTLLLGPWTEEMIRHLFWIKKSGASIDWVNSTSGEVGSPCNRFS